MGKYSVVGSGAASSMQQDNNRNAALRGQRKSLKDLHKEGNSEKGRTAMQFKEPSAAELEAYRQQLKEKQRKEKLRYFVMLGATALLVTLIFIWILA